MIGENAFFPQFLNFIPQFNIQHINGYNSKLDLNLQYSKCHLNLQFQPSRTFLEQFKVTIYHESLKHAFFRKSNIVFSFEYYSEN